MKKIKYISYLLFGFLLVSCGENFFDSIVEVDIPEHESNLAITAHLSNIDEVSLVHVTQTVGILDNENPPSVKDATVGLYSNGQLFQPYEYRVITQEPDGFGGEQSGEFYVAENPKLLQPNTTYELRVNTPKFGEITATQELAKPTPIIEATYEVDGIVDAFGDRGDEIAIRFKDQGGEKNYYAIKATGFYEFENGGNIDSFHYDYYLSPSDPIAEEVSQGIVLSDVSFDGKEYELKMAVFEYSEGLKRIVVGLHNITEDRYLYEKTITQFNDNDGNPFAEPVVIHENVSEGNGIFTMSAAALFTIEIE